MSTKEKSLNKLHSRDADCTALFKALAPEGTPTEIVKKKDKITIWGTTGSTCTRGIAFVEISFTGEVVVNWPLQKQPVIDKLRELRYIQ